MNSKSNLSHKGFTPHITSKKNLCVGFTLVEMLIVIGILAVLVAVIVSILNPAEFLRQTRDSRRLSDLNQLDKALNLATLDNVSMGTTSVVYVSIPDSSATCTNLGLPALPAGWSYNCSTEANYRKNNGTGWVPVDLTSLTTVTNALTVLPIDPVNSTSTGLYYTYVNGSWELTALFETTAYQTKYGAVDNGAFTLLYEIGSHLKVTPNAVSWRPYMSVYPVAQSDTYVKATSQEAAWYAPHIATNPTISLIGSRPGKEWAAGAGIKTNQRFQIDLGSAKIITRVYYENSHDAGGQYDPARGVKNFTLWGSNTDLAFSDTTWISDSAMVDAGWTQLTTSQGTFDIHVSLDQADPKYITVTNSTAFRYYCFKFADNYNMAPMSVRRIELQTTQ